MENPSLAAAEAAQTATRLRAEHKSWCLCARCVRERTRISTPAKAPADRGGSTLERGGSTFWRGYAIDACVGDPMPPPPAPGVRAERWLMLAVIVGASVAGIVMLGGCASGAQATLAMAAADAARASAAETEVALQEFAADLDASDDRTEGQVVDAFVARVRQDADSPEYLAQHVTAFRAALARLKSDRKVTAARLQNALTAVENTREVAAGLDQLAIESMSLADEQRRYVTGWIEAKKRADALQRERDAQRREQRRANIQATLEQALNLTRTTPAAPAQKGR